MTDWVKDANGNRCSVEGFGSREDAQRALESLKGCKNCTNCSGCSGCSGCSDCSDCSGCSDCSRCSRCSDCSGCSRCSGCSGCSDCSRCSRCSRCSGCSHVALLFAKQNLHGNPDARTGELGVPAVPVIKNIHQRVLEAAAAPGALKMSAWHTCHTTHCRAGWVVHLAGEAGYALERYHNTALAAQLIYKASAPALPVSPPRFYETNDEALEDMKRMADLEKTEAAR